MKIQMEIGIVDKGGKRPWTYTYCPTGDTIREKTGTYNSG